MEQFGKYQLVRRLGAGGMAEVFLARSAAAQGLAKLLVIKKIHPAFAKSKHFVTMFVDEAKIALGLNHPNIVQVFDFGHVGQTYYLAMEHVEGLDLLKLLQDGAKLGKRVPYGLCAYIVQQIAKGLDYAHRKTDEYGEPLGIVHRDISPQNVLVSWDGAVKIVDFGIARARDVHEEEGVVKGKFAYMSPEQARGEAVDHRSDIFSAGIVLFELACARPLFTGKGKEVLDAVKAGGIPRPREHDPQLPQQLEEIVLKALAHSRDDRYQTARDLQHALGRFQFQYAQSQDDLFDSSTLAQFVASITPREKPARLAAPPVAPAAGTPVGGAPVPVAPDAVATPVGRRHAAAGSDPAPVPSAAGSQQRAPAPAADGSQPRELGSGEAPQPAETRERKHVLVIEADLTGLATLRRHQGDARAAKTVTDFLRIAEHIAYKHEAHAHRVDPSGTEGFTYVIGLPIAGEDDASRSIRLALALVDALDGIGRDVEPDLRLSVGIQRGTAILRRRGREWSYELLGATTSIARRLAREAQGGEVLVGGGAYRLARADWNFEELTTIDLPDESSPDTNPGTHNDLDGTPRRAKIYRLRGPKERAQRMRERADAGDLVGRELELKALKDLYRDVLVARRKRSVIVVGDAGVGKRSVVTAFLKSIPPGEAMVLRSAARAATSDTPFSIVADLARDMLGLAEGAEPREVHKRIQMAVALLYPTGEAESREVRAAVQAIGLLLGVKEEGAEEIDAEERRARIGGAMRRIEERLAQDKPLVICVEDVHWADSASWEVFIELLAQQTDKPIVGIGTARPDERVISTCEEIGTTIIRLGELGTDDRVRLVLARFAPGEDARALAEEIVAKAGGNPFFIGETVEALIERGILAESRQHAGKLVWVRKDAPVQVPTSVEALVATRLDRLPDGEKETLSRAAVLGRVFAAGDLAALVGRAVDEELAKLAGRALLDVQPAGYAFRNELTLRVAYDLLPADERAALHRRAAGRLVDSPGYRAGQDDAVVARHLELAGDAAAAGRRWLAAGLHAQEMRSSSEAYRHLTSALVLLPRGAHAERFAARAERESILRAQARRPQQLREIHHMRREAEALADDSKVAQALTRLAQFYLDVGKAPAARRSLAPALDAARRSGDKLAEAAVLRHEASLQRSIGKNAEALELCAKALALCGEDRAGFLERAQILNIRGTALWNMSRLREAIEAYAEALIIYRKMKLPRHEARALNNMGIVFSALGEYEEAIAHYKRSLKIDTELGDRASLGLKLANIGQSYLDIGDLERAEQYLVKALALAEQVKDPNSLTDGTITLGQVYLKRGDAQKARGTLERGLDMATKNRTRYQEIRGLVYLALAQLAAGDPPAGALDLARSATRLAHAAPMPIGEIYGMAVEALALAKLGNAGEAADRAADAVRLLDATKDPEGAEEILWIGARLARAAGRVDEARSQHERARREVLSKAKRLRDAQLRACFLASPPAREIVAEAPAESARS